jgi:hypothetical protein
MAMRSWSNRMAVRLGGAGVLLLAAACGGPAPAESPRSPSLDYQPGGAQTSDGEAVGADGRNPADTLQTSPQVGTEGAKPAAQPADTEDGAPKSP